MRKNKVCIIYQILNKIKHYDIFFEEAKLAHPNWH
jgi:hypothetical protein